MAKSHVTIQEIATRAGVSTATVSRVVRGVDQVAAETSQKVRDAVAELGYRPSHLGQALVQRRHAALGLVFPGLAGPYYSEVIQGFEAEAAAGRLSVLILGTHLLRESTDLVASMGDRVDGLAITGGAVPDSVLRGLAERGDPLVVLAGVPKRGIPTVRSENVSAVDQLTTHLIVDHGYETLAFVGNPAGSPDVSLRLKGFRAAHRRAGLRPPKAPIRVGLEQPDGSVAASELLSRTPPPRAVVCANDETAMGVLLTVLGRGLRVPEDIAVVGFDDIPMARLTQPGLTTVRQRMRDLGAETARLLRARIDDELDDLNVDLVLETELVLRGSCGCREPHDVRRPSDRPGDAEGRR